MRWLKNHLLNYFNKIRRMSKLGFTFYPKDWWTSDMFFELEPIERYIYLEMLFYMYQNNGYLTLTKEQLERRLITQIKPSTWEKITQQLTKHELGYTHDSVYKRRSKADVSRENGKKGGRPKKPRNPEINPPLEYKEKENINIYKKETYTVDNFIKNWVQMHDGKSSLKKLSESDLENFKQINKLYSKEDFHKALSGLFKQNKIMDACLSSPKHFLDINNFVKYLDAFKNNNFNIYG